MYGPRYAAGFSVQATTKKSSSDQRYSMFEVTYKFLLKLE